MTSASSHVVSSSFPKRDSLVIEFRYLCARAARRFLRPPLERADLEQVAAVGLVKAADRYDHTSGTPFEAYAWIVVLGELMHYVRDHEHAIRVPRRLVALERAVERVRDDLTSSLGREPSDVEVAASLSVSPDLVRDVRHRRAAFRVVALDERRPWVADDPATGNLVEDRIIVRSALAGLDTLERRVVGGVYLLGFTQAQVANALRLSPKRVSRIHLTALARMRSALAS